MACLVISTLFHPLLPQFPTLYATDNEDSTEKRPKTGFLHMNHSGNFGRALEKPGFFSELNENASHICHS